MINYNELTPRGIVNIDMLANKSHAKNIRHRGRQTVQDEPDPGHHLSSTCSNGRLEEQGGNSMPLIIFTGMRYKKRTLPTYRRHRTFWHRGIHFSGGLEWYLRELAISWPEGLMSRHIHFFDKQILSLSRKPLELVQNSSLLYWFVSAVPSLQKPAQMW